jgi:DNA-binding CsgD family transcriptional regulator
LGELLERDPEVATIDEALSAAKGGAGRVVLFQAPAGLGKSSLLDAARRRAADAGFEPLAARGRELEREFSFGVARQLFEARMWAAPAAERRRLLQGSAGLAAELLGFEAPAGPRPEQGSPYPLLHGLLWLAANLADRRPLALVVDDAHWADELSLRFMLYLAARLENLPIAAFIATRPSERSAEAPVIAALAAEPACSVLHPGPLTARGTRRLVGEWAAGADVAFASACHEATAGNPFLLRELLGALEQEGVEPTAAGAVRVREIGPAPVSRAVSLALRSLPPAATALARSIAVLGDGAPLGRVAALARIGVDEAADAAADLADAGVLAAADRPAFIHPIVGRAIYEELDAAERAVAHRAATAVLREDGEPPERIAAHVLKASSARDPAAVAVLRAAAADAVRRGAPRSAVRYLRRALDEPPAAEDRADVLADLGRAEAAAAHPGAVDRLRAAIEALGDAHDRRAVLAGELGNLLYTRGRFAAAASTFDSALESLGPADEPLRMSLEAGWATAALWDPACAGELRGRLERSVRRDAEPRNASERALLSALGALQMLRGEKREEAIELAWRAWGDGAMLEDLAADDPAIWSLAGALAGSEAWDELAAVLDAVSAAARRTGAILMHATADYMRGFRALSLGSVGDALAAVDRALSARREGWGPFLPAALWVRTCCLLEQGDLDGARATAGVTGEDVPRFGDSASSLKLLDARARVLLASGDAEAALAVWREMGAIATAAMLHNPVFFPWRTGAAVAAARIGDLDEARRLAGEELEAVRRHGGPGALGVALTVRGTIERPREGLAWLGEGVSVLSGSQAELELARALVQQGTALRVSGRRLDAREPLRRGLDLADRCGADRLVVRARDELVAAGGRPRRARLSGAAALTPSERRVAELVARGLSNREAAEALFVTKKAVEFHLGNVYRKLGVSGRDQLGTALQGER